MAELMAKDDFVFSPPFARTVVTQVMSLLGRDVSLADTDGSVLASYNPSLVGKSLPRLEAAVNSSDSVTLDDGQAVGFAVTHEGQPAGTVVIHAEPGSVEAFVPLTRSLVELLITQEADQAVAGSLDQLLWQFFHSTTDAEREAIVDSVRLQGLDLTKLHFVVLLEAAGFADKVSSSTDKSIPINRFKEKVRREVQAIFPTSHDNVITYFGRDRFLLLKDATRGEETLSLFQQKSPRMFKNIGGNLTAGIGSLYLGLAGLMTSFREAGTALRLGLKLRKPGRAYFIDDLGLYIVFGDVGTDRQIQLAKRSLAPLLKEADLLKTIKAYFAANLNLTKAAAQLHIHRNTLIYRLGKIKDLTELDPENFEDAVQLKIALTLLELE